MEQNEKQFDAVLTFVSKRKIDMGIMFASIIFGMFLNWSVIGIAIFAVFIWSIIGPIPSRVLALPALFFLAFTPILLAMGRNAQAEEFSIYAYYFLVMAVVRGVVEVREEKTANREQ